MFSGAVTVGHDLLGHEGEIIFTSMGGLLLAAGHFRNLKIRRKTIESDLL